ncbi:ankyrin repeat and protein kinase domain-containing protein, partial [Colletotrichum plurivorum]
LYLYVGLIDWLWRLRWFYPIRNAQDKGGLTPLHLAVFHQQHRTIQDLCSMGADKEVVDRSIRTPLALGHYREYMDAIFTLVKAGADIDSRVLFTAAQCYKPKNLKRLTDPLALSGRSWPVDMGFEGLKGGTLLHIAVASLNLDAVKMFMEMGADPRSKNDRGQTPVDLLPKVGVLSPQINEALKQNQGDEETDSS